VSRPRRFALALLLPFLADAGTARAQGAARRLATIDALRQFPGYFHLQAVVLRGEFAETGGVPMLRSETGEIRVRLGDGPSARSGPVEVRGQVVDIGRLEPDDPRAAAVTGQGRERWPRPGEELVLQVAAVTEAVPPPAATVRALALEPWRYAGQKVTIQGNFRGRNLFGDLPGAPGKSRYDFVMRGAEGAIWVTGLRPRGRGFDLDVDRRVDTDRWLEITGTVVHERGLVRIEAERMTLARAPGRVDPGPGPDDLVSPSLPPPVQIVFSAPTDGETDVSPTAPVRIQFSKGLDEKQVAGGIRVSYFGLAPPQTGGPAAGPQFAVLYDGATRAITISFPQPLEAYRTVRVETLDTLKGFDGAPVTPWALTFSVGGP
jgi:hypothetical protein